MTDEKEITATVIALENAALRRWGNGDPSGFLEIYAPEIVYFDPYQEKRIDGVEALTKLYEGIRGQVQFDRFELINPRVQTDGKLAVLSFNYASYVGDKRDAWNCTEVYRLTDAGWRIIHTHWSYTRHHGIVGT